MSQNIYADGLARICPYILFDSAHIKYNCTTCHYYQCDRTVDKYSYFCNTCHFPHANNIKYKNAPNSPYCGRCHYPQGPEHNAIFNFPYCGYCHYCESKIPINPNTPSCNCCHAKKRWEGNIICRKYTYNKYCGYCHAYNHYNRCYNQVNGEKIFCGNCHADSCNNLLFYDNEFCGYCHKCTDVIDGPNQQYPVWFTYEQYKENWTYCKNCATQ